MKELLSCSAFSGTPRRTCKRRRARWACNSLLRIPQAIATTRSWGPGAQWSFLRRAHGSTRSAGGV